MTANQIRYQEHLENVRANRAKEAETERDNRARLAETQRYNTWFSGETTAHNRAMENFEREKNALNDAHYNRLDLETQRSNKAKETEQRRSNQATETVASYNANTNRMNAESNAKDSNTKAAIADKQWGTSSTLPGAGVEARRLALEKDKFEWDKELRTWQTENDAIYKQNDLQIRSDANKLRALEGQLKGWEIIMSPINSMLRSAGSAFSKTK